MLVSDPGSTEPLLYAITTQEMLSSPDFVDRVAAALAGGVQVLQLRDKLHPDEFVLRRAEEIKPLCDYHGVPLIINDRIEVARELGLGIHLGDEDPPVSLARQALGPRAIIGRSCHGDIDLARQAEKQGASYVAFGGVYPTPTKPDNPVIGLETLRKAVASVSLPAAAIGGIDLSNVHEVVAARPWAVCVVRAVFAQRDPEEAARRMRHGIRNAWYNVA